jgi:hypothetical protein
MLKKLHSFTSTIDFESKDEQKEAFSMHAFNLRTRQAEEDIVLNCVEKRVSHINLNIHDNKGALRVSPQMVRVSPTSDDSCFFPAPQVKPCYPYLFIFLFLAFLSLAR